MALYPVAASNKDETVGSGASTTDPSMLSTYNYTAGTYSYGRAYIDTSAIGTDVISAATFYWYHQAYTKTKTNAFSRIIRIGGLGFLSSSSNPGAAGWHSQALTAGQFSQINTSGETEIGFDMNDPGVGFNAWTIRAWDYDGAGTYACYFDVTHAPASGGPTRFSILR